MGMRSYKFEDFEIGNSVYHKSNTKQALSKFYNL